MSLAEYAAVLVARWRLVAAVTGIAVLAALTWSQAALPTYRATSTVYFSVAVGESSGDLSRAPRYSRAQVRSYGTIATMPVVLDEVRSDLRLAMSTAELRRHVEVQTPVETVVVRITVDWSTPEGAATVANAVADELSRQVEVLGPSLAGPSPVGSRPVRALTVSPAALPTGPSTPRTTLDVAVALAVGALVGACLAWHREASADRTALDRRGAAARG